VRCGVARRKVRPRGERHAQRPPVTGVQNRAIERSCTPATPAPRARPRERTVLHAHDDRAAAGSSAGSAAEISTRARPARSPVVARSATRPAARAAASCLRRRARPRPGRDRPPAPRTGADHTAVGAAPAVERGDGCRIRPRPQDRSASATRPAARAAASCLRRRARPRPGRDRPPAPRTGADHTAVGAAPAVERGDGCRIRPRPQDRSAQRDTSCGEGGGLLPPASRATAPGAGPTARTTNRSRPHGGRCRTSGRAGRRLQDPPSSAGQISTARHVLRRGRRPPASGVARDRARGGTDRPHHEPEPTTRRSVPHQRSSGATVAGSALVRRTDQLKLSSVPQTSRACCWTLPRASRIASVATLPAASEIASRSAGVTPSGGSTGS
jgi:hypothetical protein